MEYLLMIAFSVFIGSMAYIGFMSNKFTSTSHKKADRTLKQDAKHR